MDEVLMDHWAGAWESNTVSDTIQIQLFKTLQTPLNHLVSSLFVTSDGSHSTSTIFPIVL